MVVADQADVFIRIGNPVFISTHEHLKKMEIDRGLLHPDEPL